ncbi:carboxymuconolactone decarboxylase family protein [Fodinicola feengrottensis]|uniref:Carboxymuconolactone decarboxylase family protein n=1 Tax=Fodinicola feengrottensis TaxID=435914 RepID=A0ABN2HM08_9ACTN
MDKVFRQLAQATREHVWAISELTDREKVFLSVVADVCQSTLGAPFDLHVRAGVERGVSTVDIRALLRFASYDTGYHAALAAFERLEEIEAALGVAPPDAEPLPAELVSTGPDAAPSPLPPAVRAQLSELDPHFAEHFDLQSRMRSQGTLSVRERAFATMSVDVHYQTLDETFQIHVNRALSGGATVEDVRAALRFNAMFGMTRAWRAWKALNAHLASLTTAA